jgi:5-methylcytosine-specific restriction endonuclease McrA
MSNIIRVIDRFEVFVLGKCKCGCNEEIKIRSGHYLRRFKQYHHNGYKNKGINHYKYKGGRKQGEYNQVLQSDHPYASKEGYVLKHRLIMEQYLGRYLDPQEVVHHIIPLKDGGTDDITNLQLLNSQSEHMQIHMKKDMSKRLCLICQSDKTYLGKDGYYKWYKYKNGFVCMKCFRKIR